MYCKYCGHELKDNEKVCGNCGKRADETDLSKYVYTTNSYATAGLVISLIALIGGLILNIYVKIKVKNLGTVIFFCALIVLFAVIGLICSCVGRKRVRQNGYGGRACAGMVISIIAIVMTLTFLIVDIVGLYSYHYVKIHS